MKYPASRPHVADAPHWQPGPHSKHPLVARLCNVDIYSETGHVQAHLSTGHDPEKGAYLKGPDGQPVNPELVARGWILISADGTLK